jgi:hypothetical protein
MIILATFNSIIESYLLILLSIKENFQCFYILCLEIDYFITTYSFPLNSELMKVNIKYDLLMLFNSWHLQIIKISH